MRKCAARCGSTPALSQAVGELGKFRRRRFSDALRRPRGGVARVSEDGPQNFQRRKSAVGRRRTREQIVQGEAVDAAGECR